MVFAVINGICTPDSFSISSNWDFLGYPICKPSFLQFYADLRKPGLVPGKSLSLSTKIDSVLEKYLSYIMTNRMRSIHMNLSTEYGRETNIFSDLRKPGLVPGKSLSLSTKIDSVLEKYLSYIMTNRMRSIHMNLSTDYGRETNIFSDLRKPGLVPGKSLSLSTKIDSVLEKYLSYIMTNRMRSIHMNRNI